MNAGLAEPSPLATRFALALLASTAVHGMLLSSHFAPVNPRLFTDDRPAMEIVLVNAKSREASLAPDALAQVNLAGGGNTDEDRRAKSPLPAGEADSPEPRPETLAARVSQLEAEARALMSTLVPDAARQPESAPSPRPDARPLDVATLDAQARAMAQLQARIAQQWDEYQKRPRREFVGANVKEYVFARYVEDWVAKVERVGNLNYPEAARRQGIYGSLRLTVSIHSDGRVESIEIERPSGFKVLDAAAIRTVELAAPYAPFPEEIRKRADILSITRTWTFTRSDRLVGSE